MKEFRSYNFDIEARKNEEHGHFVTGRPIVFNSRTDIGPFFEEIAPGALDGAETLRDVRFLVNHDTTKIPLARSRRNNENSTMQLSVNSDGMDIRVDLDTENNTEARNLYSALERKDITGMSFMFTVEEDSWDRSDREHPTRTINKIGKVFEVSAVTFPAYDDTSINSRSKEALDEATKLLAEKRAEWDKEDEESRAKEEALKLEEEERSAILSELLKESNFLK